MGFLSFSNSPLDWWAVLAFFCLLFLGVFFFSLGVKRGVKFSLFISLFIVFVLLLRFFKLANILNLVLLSFFLIALWFSTP